MSYGDNDDSWDETDADSDDYEWATDGDDEEATIPCPYCREPIHEDSQRCPQCGEYVSREDAPASLKPLWILVGAAAGLYAMYRLIAG